MNRKVGWLLIVCLAVALSSLFLPVSRAELTEPHGARPSVIPAGKVTSLSVLASWSNRRNASWLAAPSMMPMTPLAPFIDLQEAGLTTVSDGVGLVTWDHATPQTLNVTVGGTVRFALLYWAGQDNPCPASGANCDSPVQPYKDQQMIFSGTPLTGTIIGTETSISATNSKVNNIGYFADVTSIVAAAGPGFHAFPLQDGNAGSNLASLKGASLIVAYTNAADPLLYRVLVWDNLDYAFSGDPTIAPSPFDPKTTAAVTFAHGATVGPRTGGLTIVAGDGEAAKPDQITISNNPTLFNSLDSSDDADGWDTDISTINIPAGVSSTVVQLVSPPGAGADEFLWESAMLRVPVQSDTTEPTCTQSTITGPPKQEVFSIQDVDSGLASIIVTQSSNADTVVPPFIVGTTDPVTVTATKINQSQAMHIEILVTDVAGNQHTCIYDDSACPANITQSNDGNQCGAVVTYAAPLPSGGGTVNCSPASGSFFPVGTTTVTCTETGGGALLAPSNRKASNTGSNIVAEGVNCSFTVTVKDTQGPTITCPANITQSNDPNQCGAVVNYPAPTASDNCPGVTVVCSPASGSFFPKGSTTVTCSASDASPDSGNSFCSFTVTINDTQPPAITCPANVTVVGDPSSPSTVVEYATPAASDNCPGVTVTCTPASGSAFPPGTTTVNCTASDAEGNTSSCSFPMTVSCSADASLTNTNPLKISRFRENGPNGPRDEFVEVFNPGTTDYTVVSGNCTGGFSVVASAGNGTTSNAVQQVCRIPNGTVIPAGAYFLCTGTNYSLNSLGVNGGPGALNATGDAPIGCAGTCLDDIPNDAGLALVDVGANIVSLCPKGAFGCPTGFSYSSTSASGNAAVYDSVGFNAYGPGAPAAARPSLAGNFCEGDCLQPVGDASTSTSCTNPGGLFPVFSVPPACYGQAGQYEILRRQTTFDAVLGTLHQDTNVNVNDFILVSPNSAFNMGLQITGISGVTSVLGASVPQNSNAPPDMSRVNFTQAPFDGGDQLGPRNAERNYTLDPTILNTANDPLGTFIIRLRYTNNSGHPITPLRFRIDNLSTLCGPQSAAPLVGSGNAKNLSTSPDCGTAGLTAILKVVNSTQQTVVDGGGTARTVFGTVLEDLSGGFEFLRTKDPNFVIGPGALSPLGGGVDNTLFVNPSTSPASVGDGVSHGQGVYNIVGFADPPANVMRIAIKFGVVRSGRFVLLVTPQAKLGPTPFPD